MPSTSETSPQSPLTAQLRRLGRRLTQRQTALPLSAAAIGIVGAVSAMLALQELDRAQSVPHKPFLLTFDIAEDGQAKQEVNRAMTTRDFTRARKLIAGALAQNPYNNEARLRLAYVDLAEHGRLTPETVRLVQQSYDLSAYDPSMASWRVKFVLETWDQLPAGLQKAGVDEAKAFLKSGSRVANMRETLDQITDPKGEALAKDILQGLPLGTTTPEKQVKIAL